MNNLTTSDIQNINPSIITCCSYHRNYLEKIQKDAGYFLLMYEDILAHAEQLLKNKKKEQAHFFDYGCGQGLLGIAAKMDGWGRVSFLDMNAHCIENAEKLCRHCMLTNVDFKVGNENDIEDFFKNKIKPDVLASMDVIEHVYDINEMLSILKKELPDTSLIFTTGAIEENPLRSRMMKKLQIEDEHAGSDVLQTTSDNPYAGLNFREVRKKIIHLADTEKKLSEKEVDKLVIATRGLNKKNIDRSVKEYLEREKMPTALKHPTNTCDPISSSWTERLLTVKEYQTIFKNGGYKLNISAGSYNDITNTGIKKIILKLMNTFVAIIKKPQCGAYLLLDASPS